MYLSANIEFFSSRRFSRRALLIGAAVFATSARAKRAVTNRTILFVCQFGSVKSAVAREVMRERASKRGLAVSIVSRGITPDDHGSPALIGHLAKDRIDVKRDPLTRLQPGDIAKADIVVAFDTLPDWANPSDRRDWSSVPSMNDTYPAARIDLDRRIDALLDELTSDRRSRRHVRERIMK